MISYEPEVFGGARCALVASFLGKQTARCWIFSVCSDERIPAELEQRLQHAPIESLPSRLIILGDFPTIPPERSPASFEAIRLLAEAAEFYGVLQVCWLDGETINCTDTSLPTLTLTWHDFPCQDQRRDMHVWPIVRPALSLERDTCEEMIQLIGRQPGIRISDDGLVEALNLTDGEAYRRSLVAGLSPEVEHRLWSLVKRLSNLRELRAGFSGLRAIPDLSGLECLENLDLRGNPRINLDQLSKTPSLRKFNAAACELDHVPSGIENLIFLKTLLLHKNRIQNVSSVVFPSRLERLSLYRNKIRSGYLDLSKCEGITELNLGANPLESMTLSIPESVVSMSLRLRHVSDQVRLVWRGAIGINPVSIHIEK